MGHGGGRAGRPAEGWRASWVRGIVARMEKRAAAIRVAPASYWLAARGPRDGDLDAPGTRRGRGGSPRARPRQEPRCARSDRRWLRQSPTGGPAADARYQAGGGGDAVGVGRLKASGAVGGPFDRQGPAVPAAADEEHHQERLRAAGAPLRCGRRRTAADETGCAGTGFRSGYPRTRGSREAGVRGPLSHPGVDHLLSCATGAGASRRRSTLRRQDPASLVALGAASGRGLIRPT